MDSQSSAALTAIMVAYNSAHIIDRALATIPSGYPVICVDNASSDILDAAVSDPRVRLVRNDANIGFGRACNQGARLAATEFLLFLNPDVELAAGSIDALLAAAKRYPDAGVFAPRTWNAEGAAWFSDSTILDQPARRPADRALAGDCCVGFIDGGVFMIRRSLFEDIGGFDENIFLYYEDDDLSRRLAGRKEAMIIVHDAGAKHNVGHSTTETATSLVARHRAKKISEYYIKIKFGRDIHPIWNLLGLACKVFFYAILFMRRRMLMAMGRLLGVVDYLRQGDRASGQPIAGGRSDLPGRR